jgi:L-serine dehydratase
MFTSLQNLIEATENQHLPLHEIILQAEISGSGRTREAILADMQHRLQTMRNSADKGLAAPIHTLSGLSKGNAYQFWGYLQGQPQPLTGPWLSRAVARAMAVGEVNAGMGCIVATPTAGSAGVLPAVLLTLQEAFHYSDEQLVQALFTAGGIGMVIVNRAHVSGAAGGCQAETGSASAMAAGAAVELLGGTPKQSAHAVAFTLTNQLGLICDPVAGLVEVPCILRNAGAVAQCFTAVDLALAGVESPIPADEVIDAMERVGGRMDERFRETAQGGLAATPTGRALAQAIWKQTRGEGNKA